MSDCHGARANRHATMTEEPRDSFPQFGPLAQAMQACCRERCCRKVEMGRQK